MTSATRPAPPPNVPTMSRLSSGNCSRVCLGRLGSGRGPLPPLKSLKASLNGSRCACAAYSKVSNCCITGSGSRGGAGRALTSAIHFSRFGASPGVLLMPRPQAARESTRPTNRTGRAVRYMGVRRERISGPSSRLSGGGGLGRGLFLVQATIGLDRAGKLQRRVRADLFAGFDAPWRQRYVMHGHDDHAWQRGNTADECTELVIGAHHPQRNGLLGVELLRHLRSGLEQLVGDARGECRLRDVDDQVRHFGLAWELSQHLLQLLLHLCQLQFQRLEVGRTALLGLEFGAEVAFGAFQAGEFRPLITHEQPPHQAYDQPADEGAEYDLVLLRPYADVVEAEVLQRHLFLAHGVAPPAAGAGVVEPGATGTVAGDGPAGAAAGSTGVPVAAGVAGASGTPSPSVSFGAFGLASFTFRLNM